MQASNVGVFIGPLVFGRAIHAGGWAAGTIPILNCILVLLISGLLLRSWTPTDGRVSQEV